MTDQNNPAGTENTEHSVSISPISMSPIGVVHSCYPEKFGIPRQPGIATAARGQIELLGDYANPDAIRGIEQSSHLWVLFLFSEHLDRGWTPLVRPPRSGGKKMGVFATRSTFRPNPIGMSVVKLERVETTKQKTVLHISGTDILDGTPVIDIKPYLPYADAIADAQNSYAPSEDDCRYEVRWSDTAKQQLASHPEANYLTTLINQVLKCDPRPTAHRHKLQDHEYGVRLEDVNVRWKVYEGSIQVESIERLSKSQVRS